MGAMTKEEADLMTILLTYAMSRPDGEIRVSGRDVADRGYDIFRGRFSVTKWRNPATDEWVIRINAMKKCDCCNGSGQCEFCKGTGQVYAK